MPRASVVATLLLASGLSAVASSGQCTHPPVTKPSRATIRPSTANPQYFTYNGVTRALIGASASYLCHVRQPGAFGTPTLTPAQDSCEFSNYPSYIDNLTKNEPAVGIPIAGLNKLQLWLSLNSSPGFDRGHGRPYDGEAPF